MRGNFDKALAFVFRDEGGLANLKGDPGGLTKYGISQAAYPHISIQALTLADATAIYRRDYWDHCHCDELPAGLDILAMEAAVNQGAGAAVAMLQQAAGVEQDGVIGPATLRACQAADTLDNFGAARAARYFNTKNYDRFGSGWIRRLFRNFREAIEER